MKKILFITCFYPPVGGMPSLRFSRFIKHLPYFGWKSVVVTRRSDLIDWAKDPSLLVDVPTIKVIETDFWDLATLTYWFKRLNCNRLAHYWKRFIAVLPPDNLVGWIPFAYRSAKDIIIEENISAIYTTSPMPSTHLIGYLLKKKTGLPWVAEFRDEWTHNPARKPLFSWQRRLDGWLERKVLIKTDKIVVTNDLYKSALNSLLPDGSNNKVITITNSFEKSENGIKRSRNNKFTITYVGLIDSNRRGTYTRFLTVLDDLINSGEISADMIEYRFIGHIRSWFEYNMGSLLNKVIKDIGYLPHKEAIEYIMNSDVLLLIAPPEAKLSIAGKTFEYLGSGNPILALVPSDGAAAQIIRKTKAGIVVDPMDTQGIKESIRGLYDKWEKGETWIQPDWNEISRYESSNVTKILAEILDGFIKNKI